MRHFAYVWPEAAMAEFAERDVRALLELAGDAAFAEDLEAFRGCVLEGLRRLIGSDVAAYNEVDPARGEIAAGFDPVGSVTDADMVAFDRHLEQHPLISHYGRTGDPRALRISDVAAKRRFHRLDIYQDFFLPLRLEHQLAVTLPGAPGIIVGIALSRHTVEFSDRDRLVLDVLRPSLARAYRAVSAREANDDLDAAARLGLTPREAEVLRWVATGAGNREIAALLLVSPRTVQKHLEHAFRTLGVTNRTAAVAALRAAAP